MFLEQISAPDVAGEYVDALVPANLLQFPDRRAGFGASRQEATTKRVCAERGRIESRPPGIRLDQLRHGLRRQRLSADAVPAADLAEHGPHSMPAAPSHALTAATGRRRLPFGTAIVAP